MTGPSAGPQKVTSASFGCRCRRDFLLARGLTDHRIEARDTASISLNFQFSLFTHSHSDIHLLPCLYTSLPSRLQDATHLRTSTIFSAAKMPFNTALTRQLGIRSERPQTSRPASATLTDLFQSPSSRAACSGLAMRSSQAPSATPAVSESYVPPFLPPLSSLPPQPTASIQLTFPRLLSSSRRSPSRRRRTCARRSGAAEQ